MSTRVIPKLVAFASVVLLVLSAAAKLQPAFAETGGVPELKDFAYTLIRLIQVGLAVALPVAAIFLIIGGIKYATATGDPKALEEAKRTVTYSVLGLIVAVGAITIVTLSMGLLGVPGDWDWKKVFIPEDLRPAGQKYLHCYVVTGEPAGVCTEEACPGSPCPANECSQAGATCTP